MDKKAIMRITSGAVGLGLVALGAWLTAQAEGEHAGMLILAGLAVISGGLGTSLLPSSLGPRPPSDPGAEERARRRARRGAPPGSTLTLLALTPLLAAALHTTGCGGPPRAARVAIEQLGRGLNVADEQIAAAVETRGAEARAQVRRELADGTIGGTETNVENRVAIGLNRFEALMAPTNAARDATRTARGAAEAAERAVDAWQASSGEEQSFPQIAACVAAAIERVMAAMSAAGLEYPDLLTQALNTIRPLAGLLCAEGE